MDLSCARVSKGFPAIFIDLSGEEGLVSRAIRIQDVVLRKIDQ